MEPAHTVNLTLSDTVIKDIQNAKKNIDTARSVVNFAAQIAMGNYLGAFGALGGMFGGGGEDAGAAQHAAVMAALEQINQKLDRILELQKQTLLEVRALRQDFNDFAGSVNRRFSSIESNQFKIIRDLMALYWQHEGLEACRTIREDLSNNASKYKYNVKSAAFETYADRLRFFALHAQGKNLFNDCRNFLLKAGQPSNGLVQNYFHALPDKNLLQALQKQHGNEQQSEGLNKLTTLNIYNAMRGYHLGNIPTSAGLITNCDTNVLLYVVCDASSV